MVTFLPTYPYFFRFVAQNQYMMTIALVGHQMQVVDEESLTQAYRLAPYIALHDSPAFLTCAMAPGAAYRDLQFIAGIREFRTTDQAIADRVLESLSPGGTRGPHRGEDEGGHGTGLHPPPLSLPSLLCDPHAPPPALSSGELLAS